MDNRNRPRTRQKTYSNDGKGAFRRGSGLGTGPVGQGFPGGSGGGRGIKRAAIGGGGGLLTIIVIVLMLFFNKGGSDNNSYPDNGYNGGYSGNNGYTDNYIPSGKLDTSVAAGSRDKRTQILGSNRDTVTIMVYMCGTDLESKHGMASADMEEMRAASSAFGDNFNVIVYTGGCSGWKNGVSSSVNQIYKVKNGKIQCLSDNAGRGAMTDPNTLSSFIQFCAEHFPANRNELILWDHGGGSVSGYGYDEKNKSSGSMSLAGIDKALKSAKVKFDFIGFDACLMATAENALMLDEHADYLIASEETEPGIGWY
ncbi:MAG: clostripain-related cysteine peptidase, partial [Oscillospiraceae bacterium]